MPSLKGMTRSRGRHFSCSWAPPEQEIASLPDLNATVESQAGNVKVFSGL
jgi:hypothetical protein